MTTLTVYGASDDLIVVEGDINEEFYLGLSNGADLLAFSDGTLLRIVFTNVGDGVWRITPVAQGAAEVVIVQAPEDDDENYSDRATLTGDIAWVAHAINHANVSA